MLFRTDGLTAAKQAPAQGGGVQLRLKVAGSGERRLKCIPAESRAD